jgi:D-proline reductase (dithiol) PrdB
VTVCTGNEVGYIERTRAWYRALGYERDYVWAHSGDVPFTPFSAVGKAMPECTVALIGTATPLDDTGGPTLPKRVYSLPADAPPKALFTDDLSWDKEATHTEDVETFLPVAALQALAASGRIRALGPRLHGVPTEYSQRQTTEVDAPEILARCQEDAVDIALLVPL